MLCDKYLYIDSVHADTFLAELTTYIMSCSTVDLICFL